MLKGKSAVVMVITGIGLFAVFFLSHYFGSMPEKIEKWAHNENADGEILPGKSKARIPSRPVPPISPAMERMNVIQREVESLDDAEVIKQVDKIKARIHAENLVERLNQNMVTELERVEANDLLLRLALLGVEKGKRGLAAIKPGMGEALQKHESEIAKIKEALKE